MALVEPPFQLGLGSDWQNGGQAEGVTIAEAPSVDDRPKNFSVTFENNGNFNVSPSEFGISRDTEELDRLWASWDADDRVLSTQFCAFVDSGNFDFEDLEDDELADIESDIAAELKRDLGNGVDIEFSTGGDRWDDMSVMVTREISTENLVFDAEGRPTITTSSLMSVLEDDSVYQKIAVDRIGYPYIERVLARYRDGEDDLG